MVERVEWAKAGESGSLLFSYREGATLLESPTWRAPRSSGLKSAPFGTGWQLSERERGPSWCGVSDPQG